MAKSKTKEFKNSINWVSLIGRIQFGKGKLKYIPQVSTEGPNMGSTGTCIAKSNSIFDSGSIEFTTTLKSNESRCQVILSQGFPIETCVGLNIGASAYGIMNYSNGKWEHVVTNGDIGTIPLNEPVNVRVTVKGSVVDLYVDGIKVSGATTLQLAKSQIALLMSGPEEIVI